MVAQRLLPNSPRKKHNLKHCDGKMHEEHLLPSILELHYITDFKCSKDLQLDFM
jgi:hypothetical protein